MKRFVGLLLVVLFCLAASSALANDWGLTGELYMAIPDIHAWKEYSAISNQAGNAAVMGSRYHHALILYAQGSFQVLTTAVYQPDSGKKPYPSLKCEKKILTISYGKDESYSFQIEDTPEKAGQNYLLSAKVSGLSYEAVPEEDWKLTVRGEGQTLRLERSITLDEFNILLIPRTMEEVLHWNLMYAYMGKSALTDKLQNGELGLRVKNAGKGKAPVFSSPYGDSAWRAAKGKAAVSLEDELWILPYCVDSENDRYWLVRYDVSQRTQRFGYVRERLISSAAPAEAPDVFNLNVDVRARKGTWLTDDPLVSQYAQFQVPQDTTFACMGLLNHEYAYVAAEVKNGRFVDGGAIVWGFVPLKDLEIVPSVEDEPFEDVAKAITGKYSLNEGDAVAGCGALTFYADGRFMGSPSPSEFSETQDSIHGTWSVTDHPKSVGIHGNGQIYEVTLVQQDGLTDILWLEIEEDRTLRMVFYGIDGYYQRVADAEAPTEVSIQFLD